MRSPSTGPKKPSTLRRLSEKNINFARSVGRRLSTMLNLPVGYDVKDPKMMESLPEMEPSPPSNRRESVTVRPQEETDVTFVSVYPKSAHISCSGCDLRKRLVDSSVQTDDVTKPSRSTDSKIKKGPMSFITSISIKSGISKGLNKRSGFANPAFQSKSFDTNTTNSPCHENCGENVIPYSADDIPRNRSASERTLSVPPRSQTPPLDYDQDNLMSFKRDSSFNDGSIINEDEKPNKMSKANDAYLSSSNDCQNGSDSPNNSIAHIGDYGSYVNDDVNGRVTPVEDYYEPIEIVRKSKTLNRQHSTHV